MKKYFNYLVFGLAAFSMLFLQSCDDDDDNNEQSQNIVQLAGSNDLNVLETALGKFPDLVTTLSGTTQYTVFAPTDEAFANLLEAVGQTSLDDIPEPVLREILEYHVVAGATTSSQLTAGEITTVGGEDISVNISNGVTLNGSSTVTMADVKASNGVVHVIDEVLVPPTMQPIVGTIVAPAYFNKNFTTLIAAAKAVPSVLTALLSEGDKTLFAPTNAAFEAAGIDELPDAATLEAVLTYHLIASEVMSSEIATGSSSAETLGGTIYLSKGSQGVFINGNSKVTTADIMASNGVVHVIDRTLMPPMQTLAEIVTGYTEMEMPEFTQLLAALARTQGQGANDLLAAVSSSSSNLTVFAPTDAAFEALYDELGVNGVNDIPLSTLINVLKHHVVAGRVFSSDLTSGSVGTLNGNVTVDLSMNPPTVTGSSGAANAANLQTSLLNVHATNGVIHVIDKVLLP